METVNWECSIFRDFVQLAQPDFTANITDMNQETLAV